MCDPAKPVQVVKALHKCFLFDRQGFLTEAIFNQLLSPLVAQLGVEIPAEVLELELLEAERPSKERAYEGLDAAGQAVVDCLVQMAVTANRDFLWKPLHHKVCENSKLCCLGTNVEDCTDVKSVSSRSLVSQEVH